MTYRTLVFLLLATVFSQCKPTPRPPDHLRRIALQPIGQFDSLQTHFIRDEVTRFFHCAVSIQPAAPMPVAYLNTTKSERYSADSILVWLKKRKADSVDVEIGLTSLDIYTADKDKSGQIKTPASKYAVWGILGLGYQPGIVCVVSDHRFKDRGQDKYKHRLRTVVLHEIGHNLGLPHCPNPHCIMNDANETIASVDSSGTVFCDICTHKLQPRTHT